MQEPSRRREEVPTVEYQAFGPPAVLQVIPVAVPAPGPHDVIVTVAACSVNRLDTAARAGRQKFLTGRRMPQRTGLDFSGTIVEVGSHVEGLREGQRVWGFLGTQHLGAHGAAAVQITVDAGLVAPAPSGNLTDLAALPLAGLTAGQAFDRLGVGSGSRILITGAAGGVGSVAVQMARARGAVVDTIAAPRYADLLQRLGVASRCDPHAIPWTRMTGQYQAVLDTTGAHLWKLRRCVARTGAMVTISPAGLPMSFLSSIVPGPSVSFVSVRPSRDGLSALADLVETGRLTPIIRARFPLADIASAHAMVEGGHGEGKVIVDVS